MKRIPRVKGFNFINGTYVPNGTRDIAAELVQRVEKGPSPAQKKKRRSWARKKRRPRV